MDTTWQAALNVFVFLNRIRIMQVANLVIQILYVYGYIYNHSKIMIKSGALASIDIAVLVLERNNALCLHGPMPIKWILMLSLK